MNELGQVSLCQTVYPVAMAATNSEFLFLTLLTLKLLSEPLIKQSTGNRTQAQMK
jgi:hypothetical protein